ncbi:hypothetical protein A7A78_13780 [Aequorivita soesokkakensis]|jgi:hypothetical protein|uniref:DUF4926 domain-containing protein n=1 Tax=Aequorivita soesokkakensis TaxID=1385699 RepID=A0A1A9LBX1_9FLAO|nr:DUF4926 domain-containing protein [Aequorivita soesokkakensis]OAD90778.1 hypothetical protein A7A78_13780 [Aequorivita soesokkakensis]
MKEYDIVKLKVNLNKNILKGMEGTILISYGNNEFEVEFLDNDKFNIEYEESSTFTISGDQLEVIWEAPS